MHACVLSLSIYQELAVVFASFRALHFVIFVHSFRNEIMTHTRMVFGSTQENPNDSCNNNAIRRLNLHLRISLQSDFSF